MILLGFNQNIDKHKEFQFLSGLSRAASLDANILPIVQYDKEDLANYQTDTLLAVEVASLEEFVFLISTKVRYAVCDKPLAKDLQKCADAYLTDIKVIVKIKHDSELEWVAKNEIDGCIKL